MPTFHLRAVGTWCCADADGSGASGGVELVICMKALADNVCPPTINYTTPDPACDLDYTPNKPRESKLSLVMSNSFGFGGHNASIIAGRAA